MTHFAEMRSILSRVVGRALLVAASVTVALLILEGAMRLYAAEVMPNLFVLDPEIGWIHHANAHRYRTSDGTYFISFDPFGLRGRPHLMSTSRKRVLLLGDSFTEGIQVSDDEVVSNVWERLRPDLAIFNSGVGGYSTLQEIMLARRLEPIIRPDVEILMVFGGNDLTDNIAQFQRFIGPRPYVDANFQIRPPDWNTFAPLLPPVPGACWVYRHSLAAYAVYRKVANAEPGLDARQYREVWRRRVPDVDEWRVMESLLTTFAEGRRLIVVAIPSLEDVASGDRTFATRLGQIVARIDVPFVDLQPDLRPDDYIESERHWNAAGHAVAGRRLASAILPSTDVATLAR